jgi:hypothetical protein
MEDDRRRAFAEQMISTLTGGAMSMLVSVGYRTGLFDAAARGPGTSVDLAGRAGLQERYVREWLGAMVTGGFFSYDPASGQYALPAEHAAFLTGDTAANVAPMASMLRAFGGALPELERCFVAGGGVAQAAFGAPSLPDHDRQVQLAQRLNDVPAQLTAADGILTTDANGDIVRPGRDNHTGCLGGSRTGAARRKKEDNDGRFPDDSRRDLVPRLTGHPG